MVKKDVNITYATVWMVSVVYGVLAVPVDFLISLKSGTAGFIPSILVSFRSAGFIMLSVALIASIIFILIRAVNRIKHDPLNLPLQQTILIGSGILAVIFFILSGRYYYNEFKTIVVVEVIGGVAVLSAALLFKYLLRSVNTIPRFGNIGMKFPLIGIVIIACLFVFSFMAPVNTGVEANSASVKGRYKRPNILLIVMDTVRADHLSLYGYHRKTTPFLEKMAAESAVFDNAFSTAPWTLPAHASLFTGLYVSQHNTHGEHFWLDNSFRTLPEILHDNGYQTVSFSNNDYVTSYHNLVQGFERTWFKRKWTDALEMPARSLGGSVSGFINWTWSEIQTEILAKIIKNPASIRAYPPASVTNKAVLDWLGKDRDKNRPFFIFINYMDAHFPYNPDDETARLFLNDDDLKKSYNLELRFPSVEHSLDVSKSGYTKDDIRIMSSLYDACIYSLDRELKTLFEKIKNYGVYDDTVVIITSDHGEYLGTRNRLAHGVGLHEEVIHVPLIARYPDRFNAGRRYDTVVSLIDIPETVLSIADIKERPKGKPETQALYDPKPDFRPYVFSELRFPLHLLMDRPLLQDNSGLFVEQKTVLSKAYQFIWKSRGEPELYNLADDPSAVNNIYSKDNEAAKRMGEQLLSWRGSLYIPAHEIKTVKILEEDNLKLIDKLRAIGYIN